MFRVGRDRPRQEVPTVAISTVNRRVWRCQRLFVWSTTLRRCVCYPTNELIASIANHSLLPTRGWLRESERRRDSVLKNDTTIAPPSAVDVVKERLRSVLSCQVVA